MKYTAQGIAIANMGIAVDRNTKDDQGAYETDFFNITAWRRTAEFAANYLKKGRLVAIDGRVQSRSWVDQQSGQKKTVYEIVAENIQGLDRGKDGENGGGDDGQGQYQDQPPQRQAAPSNRPPAAQNRPPASRPAPQPEMEEADPFADE